MGDWAFSTNDAFPRNNNQGTPPPHMQGPGARNESPPATSAGFPASRMGFGVWTVPPCPGGQANGQRDHVRFSSESLATLTQPGNVNSGWSSIPGAYTKGERENGLRRSTSNELRSHLLNTLPPSASIESFQKRMSEVRTALQVASLAIHATQEKNDVLVETCATQQALSQSMDLQIVHLNKMIQCMSISESDARRAQEVQNSVDEVVAAYEKSCHKLAIVAFEKDALEQRFDSIQCGLVEERDRASMEAGQLRVSYSAKNREVEELRKRLKEKEAREAAVEVAHENGKLKLEAEIAKLNSQNEKERKAVSDLEESNKQLKSRLRDVEEEVERWREKAERLQYELDENEIEVEIQESKIASWEASDEASILRKYQTELDIIRSKADKKEQEMRLEVSLAKDQLRDMEKLDRAFKEKCFEVDELRKEYEALERVKDQLQDLLNANMMREAVEEEPIEGYCELLGISSTSSSMVIKERRPIMKDTSSQTKKCPMKAKGIHKANYKHLRQQSELLTQHICEIVGGIKNKQKEIDQRDLEEGSWYAVAISNGEEIQRVQGELAMCRTENREMGEETYRYQVRSSSLQDQLMIGKLREEVLEKERELERLRLEGSGSNAAYEEKLAQLRLDMEAESVASEMEARCRVAEEVNREKGIMEARHTKEKKLLQDALRKEHEKKLDQEIKKHKEKKELKNCPVLVNAETQTMTCPELVSVAIQAWPDPIPTKNEGVQASPEPTPVKHMSAQASPEPTPIKNASVQAWPVDGDLHDVEVQTYSSVLHISVQTESDGTTDMLLESIDAEIQTEFWEDGNASGVTETGIQTETLDENEDLGLEGAVRKSSVPPTEGSSQNIAAEIKRRVVDRYDHPKKGFLSCGLECTLPPTESDIASRSVTSDGTEFEDNLGGNNNAATDGPCSDETSFDPSREEISRESMQRSEDPGDSLSLPDDIPPPGVWFGDQENSWSKARKEANVSPSSRFETPPRQVRPYDSPPTQRTKGSPWSGWHQESDATPRWKKYSNNEMELENNVSGNPVPLQDATSPTINQARWNGERNQEMPPTERVGLPTTPQSQVPGAWKPRRQGRTRRIMGKNEAKKVSPPRAEMKGQEQDDFPSSRPSHTRWSKKYNEPHLHTEKAEDESYLEKIYGNQPFELRKSQDNGNGGLDVVAAKSFGENAIKRGSQVSSFDDSSDDFESNRCGLLYGSAAREHAQNVLNGLRWSDRLSSEDGAKRDGFGQSAGIGGIRQVTPMSRSRLGTPQVETGAESPTLPEPRRNPSSALDSMTAPHNAARYARERYSVSASVKRSLAQCGPRPPSLHLDTVPESSHRNGVDRFVNQSRYGAWNDSHEYSTWNGSSDRSVLRSPRTSVGDEFQMGMEKMVQSSKKLFETCAVQEEVCRKKNEDTSEQLRVSLHQTRDKLFDSKTQILRNSSLVTPRQDEMDMQRNSSVYGVPTNSPISSSKKLRNRHLRFLNRRS